MQFEYDEEYRKMMYKKLGEFKNAEKNEIKAKTILKSTKSTKGYVYVKTSSNEWMGMHRYVMEKHLKRKLKKFESVHHINGIRDDNDISNLELWVGGIRYGQRANQVICPHCKKPYLKRPS